jgi:hypothetical protein
MHEHETSRFETPIHDPETTPSIPQPTAADLEFAHAVFESEEPRDLFYKAAMELVDSALRGTSRLTLAEAIAVLLQTWNRPYYQFRIFDEHHFQEIERLLEAHEKPIADFRRRSIADLSFGDANSVTSLFHAFEMVLGPVGAAKALHLLAPRVFPLWDRAIARGYSHELGRTGSNATHYWQFLQESKQQWANLDPRPTPESFLKAIDEYNYVRLTKHLRV